MSAYAWFWLAFGALFLVVLTLDLVVTGRRQQKVAVATALRWTALWMAVALGYGAALYLWFPQIPGSTERTGTLMVVKFVSGYLTEYSLSVDNLFVFIMIFSLMGVSERNQPRLLKAGILLSIVLRVTFIALGMGLVHRFHWLMYVFGIILIWTAQKMALSRGEEHVDPQQNLLYRLASRVLPVHPDPHLPQYVVRIDGRLYLTATCLVFLVIGSTDVLFAVDSIPAIIGVIQEGGHSGLTPALEDFLAITSNVFAVMGLVSLFFALRGVMGMFRYLKSGVSLILLFVGVKMLLVAFVPVEQFFHHHAWVSLVVIVGTLALSILLSILFDSSDGDGSAPEEAA